MFSSKSGIRSKGSVRGIATLTGLLALTLTFTACSGASEKTEPSAVASETVSPAVTETAAPKEDVVQETGMAIAGSVIETDKGKYRQIVLPADSPAYNIPADAIYPEVMTAYSTEDLKTGSKAAIDYMVKTFIDPPVIDGELDRAIWWETAKEDFLPEAQQDFYSNLGGIDESGLSKSSMIENRWWADKEYNDFSYVYNENETRIENFSITPTDVWVSESRGDLAVQASISYEMPATYTSRKSGNDSADGTVKETSQKTTATISLSVTRNSAGKWVIAEWQVDAQSPTFDKTS